MNEYNKMDYQKALKKIEDDQRCLRNYCNIASNYNNVGSTGPTGATGPAPTLTIGTVTTGAPGTAASVTITQST